MSALTALRGGLVLLGLTGLVGMTAVTASPPDEGSAHGGRPGALSFGIENVNDSPMKAATYRTLLRIVARDNMSVDRIYFGFKLRGAQCWDPGSAGYGAGDGGLMEVTLVQINRSTGLPGAPLASETVNGCQRYEQAKAEVNQQTPVLAWASLHAQLRGGRMYGLVIRNRHAAPAQNFFSFNAPIADAVLAGPHGRNELRPDVKGALMSMDPREHVAWSDDNGIHWRYGKLNGQYLSYINDHDTRHPATRLPQYGFRRTDGVMVPGQPYYAYSVDCIGCTVAFANATVARDFTQLAGFTAGESGIGTLTLRNTSTGQQGSCTPVQRYGHSRCTLAPAVHVEPGHSYTVHASGNVELMKMDYSQRLLFPHVGTGTGPFPASQPDPGPGSNTKDVPSLWAGPLSAHVAD